MTVAVAAANAAASLAPASSSLIRHRSASRFLLLCRTGNPRPTVRQSRIPVSSPATSPLLLRGPSPLLRRPLGLAPSPHIPAPRWRLFCSRALSADAEACEKPVAEAGKRIREFRKRLRIVDVKGGPDEGMDRLGQKLAIRGWVRTCRVQSSVTFIEVNDGSCLSNLQCVMNIDAKGYDQVESGAVTTGTSVLVEGIVVSSQGSKQKVELKVARLVTFGKSDPLTYPIQKKRTTREFLRTIAHLRPRTNTFGAVTRVRNALAYATHKFFQENGFVWISSPIITASDCEGAGEQFCVTTLIPNTREGTDCLVNTIPTSKDGKIDWSQDFFGRPAFLTVSGQLNAETYASALCDVYTFGPTFRAENSNTSRHLAEFWMIEPELAFADLNDDMACATAYLQYVVKYILDNCKEDMDFFNTWIEKGIINRLNDVVEKDFVQLTYSDAVELLLGAKKKFEFPVMHATFLINKYSSLLLSFPFSGLGLIIQPVDPNNIDQPDKTPIYDSAVGLSKHIYWLLQTNKIAPNHLPLIVPNCSDLCLFVLSNLTLIALEPTFHATWSIDVSMEPHQGIEHTASTLRTWDLTNSSGNSLPNL